MMDHNSACVSVALYHLSEAAASRLSPKDTVILLDPIRKSLGCSVPAAKSHADAEQPREVVSYDALQVISSESMYVNGTATKATFPQADLRLHTFDF
jgi:hypothetical protein